MLILYLSLSKYPQIEIALVSCVFLAIVTYFLRKRWKTSLKKDIQTKNEELSAVNQELIALNQELTAVNQELEASYESLQILSEQLNRTIEFMGKIDLKSDPFPFLEKIFRDTKKLLEPLAGLELRRMDRRTLIGQKAEKFIHKSSKEIEVKLFFFRDLERDEENFLNSIVNFSFFLLNAHNSHLEVLRNNSTLSTILSSLEEILSVSNRTQLLEKVLRYLKDMFPKTVLSSLSIFEKETVETFFIRDGKLERVSPKKGIVVKALKEKRDLILNDVSDFPEFYDVTNGRAKAAAAVFFEYEGIPVVIEIERETGFTEFEFSTLRMMARIFAIFFSRLNLYRELRKTFFQTIEAFSYAVELKDPYTSGHSVRVSEHSQEIARRMGLPKQTIEKIKIAALLHDIGKIGIRGAILNKTSKLTEEEYEEVKKHPELGERLISKIESFSDIAKIVRHHHEWYGGGGYPDNISGEEIPIESRIIAVADAFDAMTSNRPYRKAMKKDVAIKILEKNEGFQWDPKVLRVALKYFKKI
ncbi:metal-dependent phosphohydrolase [Thermotoga sp. KOL6]|nr:metal-dependent phosphohydrolase [Thermotoga sp. KOL6]